MNMDLKITTLDTTGGVELRRPPRPPLLKPERIQERLKALPSWRLMPGDEAIGSLRQLQSAPMAASYAAFVAGYAGFKRLPVTLECSGKQVMITLRGRDLNGAPGGLTEEVFDFAEVLG
jgi:hypothetical protein